MSIGCPTFIFKLPHPNTPTSSTFTQKRPNGHCWLVLCSPGSLLILAHLPHCRKRIGKLSSIQNIGPTQATPSSPTHPSWAQRRCYDYNHLHLALGMLPTHLWGRNYCPLHLAVKETKLRSGSQLRPHSCSLTKLGSNLECVAPKILLSCGGKCDTLLGWSLRPRVLHSHSFHLRLSREGGICEVTEGTRLKEPLLPVKPRSNILILS